MDSEIKLKPLWSIKTDKIEAIISQEEFENFKPDDSLVVISIQDPDDEYELDYTGYKDYINIRFWDIEKRIYCGRKNYYPITKKIARQIVKFILKYKDDRFLIHCGAGISRSAGVGLFIECLTECNGDYYKFSFFNSEIKSHPRYYPNYYVFKKLLECYNEIIGKEIPEKIKLKYTDKESNLPHISPYGKSVRFPALNNYDVFRKCFFR